MTRMVQKFGPVTSAPECFGEPVGPESVLPGGARVDAAQFPRLDRVAVAVAAAAAGATSVGVTALTGTIPAGVPIELTGGKWIELSLTAIAGATTVTTRPLPQALAGTETGAYPGDGRIAILKGTPLGRTITERNAGTGFGPAVDTDDEIYLNARYIEDAGDIDECTLYKHNRVVYENFLPGVGSYTQNLLTKLRGLYHMTLGA